MLLIQILAWLVLFLNNVIGSDKKGCHFNDAIIHRKVFPNHACWKCYENFTDRNRLSKVYCLVQHESTNFTVPGFVVQNECVPFDYRSTSISYLVQSSLPNGTFHLWMKCCRDAMTCCDQTLENYQVENFFNTCDAHWDGMSCFMDTNPGSSIEQSCPHHMIKYDESTCNYFYAKTCQSNGSWSKSDFSQCHQNERLSRHNLWHVALLSLSLLFCLIPLVTLIICKTIHGKHLKPLTGILVFVALRNLLKLILLSIIYNTTMTLTINSIMCRLLTSFMHFSGNMSYTCLTLVTLKLLQIVRNVKDNWGMFIMMSIGLLMSIATTITWSMMMKIYSDKLCWIAEIVQNFHWINDGMQFFMLLLTLFFVISCVVQRTEKYDNEMIRLLKLFIIPFIAFFVPFIFIIISSIFGTCGWEEFFKFIITSLEMLQAAAVCLIFFCSSTNPLKINSFWSTTKISSQNSNASLAPSSRLSFNREEAINWQDVVTYARNSVCYDNVIVSDGISSTISTSPEPYTGNESQSNLRHNQKSSDNPKRHTIRQVMLRAKNNVQHVEEISPRKCSTPHPLPLPKVIPDQILDDVQLFDFYYKNLDTLFISDSGSNNVQSTQSNAEKRSSIKKISRILSLGSDKQKKPLKEEAEE